MPPGYSGNSTHNATQTTAELTRQVAVAAATTQVQINTAAINYHRTVAKSALANNVGCEPNLVALKGLGVGLY
jgi:hypothetical protein